MSADLNLKEHVNGHCVSTVALSVPHSWAGGDGYLFETYIFPSDGSKITDWLEEWGTRYRTVDEAVRGHAAVVAQVKAGDLP